MKVSLLYYVNSMFRERDRRAQQRFEAQTKAIDSALLAVKEATAEAKATTENRFQSVNEFRQTLSDQTQTFVTRREFDRAMEQMAIMAATLSKSEGRMAGSTAGWGYLMAVIGIVIAAGGVIAAIVL